MAEPSWDSSDTPNADRLWQLLNTPVFDGNESESTAMVAVEPLPAAPAHARKQQASARRRSQKSAQSAGEKSPREKGFTKRGPKRERKLEKKPHTFKETTQRIGFSPALNTSPIGHADTHRTDAELRVHKPGFLTLVFGVLLPVAAMSFELTTHTMAKMAFDPFPTLSHVLLFLLVPASNFLTWLAVRLNLSSLYSMVSLSGGMALGIAILYSLMLLPMTPMFLATAAIGIGFLGLAPLLSIPVTLMCGKTICQLADRHKTFFDAHQLKHLGHLIILVMVIAVELPSTLTRANLSMATDPNKSAEAINWLRQWGSQDVLLRACYERSGEATDILGSLAEHQHPVSVDQARRIFYQVTGVSFNSVPIPPSFRGTIRNAGLLSDPAGLNADVKDEFDLDPDIAGELVSGVARGLSLSQSSMSGTLDGANGIAALDWDFTFDNVSTIAREARAKILLPPDAVVTGATLWLDDLKKETVIQERGLARQTYQESVMSHKRDPLLVSMAGKDSVLVQCYPVVKGTRTKIRLHIVAPLVITGDLEESLVLPTFEERNFAVTNPHKISLTSKNKISVPGRETNLAEKNGLFELNTSFDNALLARFEAVPRINGMWKEAPGELTIRPPESSAQARQELYPNLPDSILGGAGSGIPVAANLSAKPKGLTIVIDKSITMAPYIKEIVAGLKAAPTTLPVSIVEVKDGYSLLCAEARSNQPNFQNGLATLLENKCEGGQTDAPALEAVFAEHSRGGHSASRANMDVLWIHAAQPINETSVDSTISAIRSGQPDMPALYDLQVASGPNAILSDSYKYAKLNRVVRTGKLSDDIATFLENFAGNKIRRCATTIGTNQASSAPEVAQVQAYKLALARYQAGDSFGAYKLAARYHLVTPVSSAVVTDEVPMPAEAEAEKRSMVSALDRINQVNPMAMLSKAIVRKEMERARDDQDIETNPEIPGARRKTNRSIDRIFGTRIYEDPNVASLPGQGSVGAPVSPPYGQSNQMGSPAEESDCTKADSLAVPLAMPSVSAGRTALTLGQAVGGAVSSDYAEPVGKGGGGEEPYDRAHAQKKQILNERPNVRDFRQARSRPTSIVLSAEPSAKRPARPYPMRTGSDLKELADRTSFEGGDSAGVMHGTTSGTVGPQEMEELRESRSMPSASESNWFNQAVSEKLNSLSAVSGGYSPGAAPPAARYLAASAGVETKARTYVDGITIFFAIVGFIAWVIVLFVLKMSTKMKDDKWKIDP